MCLYPIIIPVRRKGVVDFEPITVACGKCVECLQQKATEWSVRIMKEAEQYEQNCFITLTYNNEHLPENGTLVKKDLQDFLKRLRRKLEPRRIRFFACGEYGSKGLRPHYHLIVFNWKPDDIQYWQTDKSGEVIYRSKLLETVWTYGFSSVGNVTVNSARYCAKYMQKFNALRPGCIPPYTVQSNRPGIGYSAIDPKDLSDDRLYAQGKSIHLPRYFLKVLEREGHDLTEFIDRRCKLGKLRENPDLLLQRRKKAKEFLKNPLTKN